MKTLVVDDDFTNRLILQEILKVYGDVHIAVDGKEALEAFKHSLEIDEPYHLVFLDILMPEMDGHETLEKMREEEKKAGRPLGKGSKIIITTALKDSKNIMKSFRNACDGFITKPIDKAKLINEVRKILV